MNRAMHIISSSIRMALAHKMRVFLTSLGVVVGVVAVTGIGTASYSLQKNLEEQISKMGGNTFYIMRVSFTRFIGGKQSRRKIWKLFDREEIKPEYYRPLKEGCPSAEYIAPVVNHRGYVRYKKLKTEDAIAIVGTNDEYDKLVDLSVREGRFLIPSDVQHRRYVAVIGSGTAGELFPSETPIGKTIKIRGYPFVVIGVLDSIGSVFGQSKDDNVIVPYTTFGKLWHRGWWNQIAVKAKPGMLEQAQDEAINVLRRLRGLRFEDENDFDFMTSDMILSSIGKITGVAYFVMLAIAAVSLLVAGIGIMNIMYVTVRERTHEIGIRKSVGARASDIVLQFAAEAVIISGLGGLIGIAIIIGLVTVLGHIPNIPLKLYFPVSFAIIGIIFSFVVGVVFGIAPARRASTLSVATALRYE